MAPARQQPGRTAGTGSSDSWTGDRTLLALLLLNACGIYLFTRGFLLTRVELPSRSSCDDITHDVIRGSDDVSSSADVMRNDEVSGEPAGGAAAGRASERVRESSTGGREGWGKERNGRGDDEGEEREGRGEGRRRRSGGCRGGGSPFERVVILVVDAARFDFASDLFRYPSGPGPWVASLSSLQQLLLSHSSAAALFRFVADPPTTSQQRLKGLMTGSLPTFIDIGSSFGGSAIEEDNLLLQLAAVGKRVEMMGDDTWLDLFPHHFARATPFPSLVVKDIHTVDNGVLANLFPALHRDNWDVLIAHFLGVDHVGHTFSVDSSVMADKLQQMNQMLLDVVAELTSLSLNASFPPTLLLLMSDHGQTMSGDHGGGTPEETDAILFALSFSPPPLPAPSFLSSPICSHESFNNTSSPPSPAVCAHTMPQIDFAPTLSALLGAPIPYNSLGKVDPVLWSLSSRNWGQGRGGSEDREEEEEGMRRELEGEWMDGYAQVLAMNSWQVFRYLTSYSAAAPTPFPSKPFNHLLSLFHDASNNSKPPAAATSSSSFSSALRIQSHLAFLSAAADLARSQWTQFDLVCMTAGLAVLCLSLLNVFCLLLHVKGHAARGCHGNEDDSSKQRLAALPVDYKTPSLTTVTESRNQSAGYPSQHSLPRRIASLFSSPAAVLAVLAATLASLLGPSLLPQSWSPSLSPFSLLPSLNSLACWELLLSSLPLLIFLFALILSAYLLLMAFSTSFPPSLPSPYLSPDSSSSSAAPSPSTLSFATFSSTSWLISRVTTPLLHCRPTTTTTSSSSSRVTRRGSSSRAAAVILLSILHCLSRFSNSFILCEGHLSAFMLATVGCLNLHRALACGCRKKCIQSLLFLLFNAAATHSGLHSPYKPPPPSASRSSSSPTSLYAIFSSLSFTHFPLLLFLLIMFHSSRSLRPSLPTTLWRFGLVTLFSSLHIHFGAKDLLPSLHTNSPAPSLSHSPLHSALQPLVNIITPRIAFAITLLLPPLLLLIPASPVVAKLSLSGETREVQQDMGKKESDECDVLAKEEDDEATNRSSSSSVLPDESLHFSRALTFLWLLVCSLVPLNILLQGTHSSPLLLLVIFLQGLLFHQMQLPAEVAITQDEQGKSEAAEVNGRNGSSCQDLLAAAAEWSLVANSVFFFTGHRCTFDGLHYAAAFTGFSDFNYHIQGTLLAINTFGSSHLLPTLSLPLLLSTQSYQATLNKSRSLKKMFLAFVAPRLATTIATTAFVFMERRHLMVWGLFAPKFVFDAIGMLVLVSLVSLLFSVLQCFMYHIGHRRQWHFL